MKVVMLGCMPPQRGISAYCLEISRNLSKKIQVEFISFKKMYPSFLYPGGGLEEDYTFPNVENNNLKIRRNLTYYNPLTWITEAFKTNGDVFHAQFWSFHLFYIYFLFLFIYKLRGIKTIMTIHNVIPHESNFLQRVICKQLYKIPDKLIVHSESNKKYLQEKFLIKKNIEVIPHGPLDFFNNDKISKKEARKKLGIEQNAKVVLFFGAIREYKGLDILIRAFAIASKKDKNLILLITGKLWTDWKPYQNIIDQYNLNKKIIKHLSYMPSNEVKYFFKASDILVLPYKEFNAQSGVGATAISFNKPIITSNISGLSDLKQYGAITFKNKDIKELADKIVRFKIKNKNRKLLWTDIIKKTKYVYQTI